MNIREYLDSRHKTIKDLAEACNVSEHYAWLCTSGKRNPSISLAFKMYHFMEKHVPYHKIRQCTRNCYEGCLCGKGVKQLEH